MTDRDIEDLLRRYRPSDPPPELRARALSGRVRATGGWAWIAAAAALLIVSVAGQWSAAGIRERLRPPSIIETTGEDLVSLRQFLPADEEIMRAFETMTSLERERRGREQSAEPEPSPWQ
jgi:hypothetical protein